MVRVLQFGAYLDSTLEASDMLDIQLWVVLCRNVVNYVLGDVELRDCVRVFLRYFIVFNDVILLPVSEIVLVRWREFELFTILVGQLGLELVS